MPTLYLAPDDLTPAQAAVILEYLNSVDDPAAMAARIELEHELDIGEALAKRIIDARKKQGGAFETLEQVYAVPYIGPERFSEIAIALLNLEIPSAASLTAGSTGATQASLMDEITRLRQQLDALQVRVNAGGGSAATPSARRIQLRVVQGDVFLGQHVTVEIQAFNDQDHSPLVDQPITLCTNWGILQYQQGYGRQQDSVVEVRTDIEGKARVRLRSETYETLTQEQQLALEAALARLDAKAPTPQAIREQLQNLVLSYRLENNRALRNAIDIYFNARKVAILEAVNRRFFSDHWQFHHALISAYLHDPANNLDTGQANGLGNGRVETLSTVKVRLKDWLGAWYQTYLDFLENGNQFSERVQDLSKNAIDGSRLINGVLSEISSWTLGELGVAGSVIGEKSTESAVRKFLADDIQQLPNQQQLQLYSALSVAVRPSAVTQVGTLQAVADTQLTLVEEINTRFDGPQGIATLADGVLQQMDVFNDRYQDFQTNFNRFTTDYATFNDRNTQFGTHYATFNSAYATFNTRYSAFNSNYSNFNNDYAQFNNNYSDFNTNYSDFNNNYLDFNNNYLDFNDSFLDFNNNYGNFNVRINDFNSNYRDFSLGLSAFNSKYSGLDTRMNQIDNRLNTVNSNFASVQADISNFNVRYTEYTNSLGSLRADIGDLKNSVQRIDSRVLGPNR